MSNVFRAITGLFKTPKAPPPVVVPPPPTLAPAPTIPTRENSVDAGNAARAARQRFAGAGRKSTILGGQTGDVASVGRKTLLGS